MMYLRAAMSCIFCHLENESNFLEIPLVYMYANLVFPNDELSQWWTFPCLEHDIEWTIITILLDLSPSDEYEEKWSNVPNSEG